MKKTFFLISLILFLKVSSLALADFGADLNNGPSGDLVQKSCSWKELIFEGSKASTRFLAEIRLTSNKKFCPHPLDPISTGFLNCPMVNRNAWILTAETVTFSLILPQDKYVQYVWFNPLDLRAYQRIRWRRTATPWIKIYKWQRNGVSREKFRPAMAEEASKTPDKWSKKTNSFYKYPRDMEDCHVISEPTLLFYLLSSLDTAGMGSPFELCVFGKKQLHRLTISPERSQALKITYKIQRPGQEKIVDKKVKTLVFGITSASVPSDDKDHEIFSLLGLQKKIRLYLDPSSHLPLRITGVNKNLGELEFELIEASVN
jgi:hypothetical protein